MQNLPACLPACRPAGLPACLRARCHAAMQQARWLVGWWAGGWWLVAGRPACPDRGGRAGPALGVSVTAASENNFSKFFIPAS